MVTWGHTGPMAHAQLSRRDTSWVLRRCALRGHVLAHLDDPALQAATGPLDTSAGTLLRCLRCGTWVDPADPGVRVRVGSAGRPARLADVPLPARGPHGRRFGLLRVLAVERALRGILMILAGMTAYHVADVRGSLLSAIERLAIAAKPLGEQLGVHITDSWLFHEIEHLLGGSGDPVRLLGVGLVAYGVVQIIEGIGLWGGWRWAEYLSVVVTAVFIPLEVYEIIHRLSAFKVLALAVNIFVVVYLVWKGRLFGIRGGHEQYLAELRDSTLPADVLRSIGRPTSELTSSVII